MRVLVGVVTYKPDEEKLNKCLKSVENEEIFIFDNTTDNKGIAFALKKIMEYATDNSFDYVLTLDQDSEVKDGLIEEYKKIMRPETGALTCIIKDKNFYEDQKTGEIDWCITSGCFMSVEAYNNTPGYDEKLFIDMVDMDVCYSLREAGYKIIRIPFVGLEHEVGKGKNTPLGVAYNHEPWRDYYIVRNRLLVARKHNISYPELRVLRDIMLICLFEKKKIIKIKHCIKGIKDYTSGSY